MNEKLLKRSTIRYELDPQLDDEEQFVVIYCGKSIFEGFEQECEKMRGITSEEDIPLNMPLFAFSDEKGVRYYAK